MAVTVWAVQLKRPLTAEETERLMALLPSARRERLHSMGPRGKRDEVLCAYGLLERILRERYGWTRLPDVALTETGKPYFPEYPQVCFNLSHTEGAAAAVVAEEAVGVDVEKVRPVSQRMLTRFKVDSPEAFFHCWVRQEACGKRSGKGILPVLREKVPPEEGTYLSLALFVGYAAGLAGPESDMPPEVRIVSQEELLK